MCFHDTTVTGLFQLKCVNSDNTENKHRQHTDLLMQGKEKTQDNNKM